MQPKGKGAKVFVATRKGRSRLLTFPRGHTPQGVGHKVFTDRASRPSQVESLHLTTTDYKKGKRDLGKSKGNDCCAVGALPPRPESRGFTRIPMKNPIFNAFAPNATNLIRMDHTHVLATYHQYKTSSRPQIKQGLVNTTCLALEIHAQLEEEIFYPAVRAVSTNPVLQKSVAEHDEMRRLISLLRGMSPDDVRYDETYHELMRDVIHHVADEETVVLPEAERLLAGQLGELGQKMMKRRVQLMAPHGGDMAANLVRAMPGSSMAMLAGAVMAGVLVGRRSVRH